MKRRMTKDGTVRPTIQNLPAAVDRRDFIKASALVAGMGVWVATSRHALGEDSKSPNEMMGGASIGVGGKGDGDSDQLAKHTNLVAICDTDEKTVGKKGDRHPKAKKYTDFRKMLDEMGKEIDAVTISTPDHTHAVATMMAIKMGKNVYTQKPLAHDVWEARQLRLAANEHKIASQMGNQGTAGSKFREGVEVIRAGHHRTGEGSTCLDEPSDLAAGAESDVAASGNAGAGKSALGSVAWHRSRASLQPRISTIQLARLVGLRHRGARRHGLPYRQPAVHGDEARPSDFDRRRVRRSESRNLSVLGEGEIRVCRPRRYARSDVPLV